MEILKKWDAQGPFKVASWVSYKNPRTKKTKTFLDYRAMDKNLQTFANHKGLYFIFCRRSLVLLYPVYIGMTSQTFRTRLNQHKREVLGDISIYNWRVNFCKDFVVYVKDLNIATAKFLESTFLAAFNFARNTEENIGKRDLDSNAIASFADGKAHLKKVLTDEIKILKNFGKILVG